MVRLYILIISFFVGFFLVRCGLDHGGTCPDTDPACKDYNDRAKGYGK